ncbi:MAG: CoA transferase, partial [Myxococcota bacterium]|nr:CoA transferase [Myxococcota bacterium]
MTVPGASQDLERRPLSGLRVLDLSRLLPGPFATMILADLGARVDKVEDPAGGDYLRFMPPMVGDPAEGTPMNTAFHLLNRGKRSAVLDLKKPEGQDALRRLIPRYDVLIESFRPGVMARLGLGYETLREAHPGLVYCAITGYGQDGPAAQRAGHDIGYLARAGVLGLTGPEQGPPQVPGVQ